MIEYIKQQIVLFLSKPLCQLFEQTINNGFKHMAQRHEEDRQRNIKYQEEMGEQLRIYSREITAGKHHHDEFMQRLDKIIELMEKQSVQ